MKCTITIGEDLALIDRNKKHLEIMLAKDFWTE
jgi:hypothetical protein